MTNYVKKEWRHVDEMNAVRDLKRHDFSFLLLSRANIGWKTFLRLLWKVLIHCDYLNLGCLKVIATSRQQ